MYSFYKNLVLDTTAFATLFLTTFLTINQLRNTFRKKTKNNLLELQQLKQIEDKINHHDHTFYTRLEWLRIEIKGDQQLYYKECKNAINAMQELVCKNIQKIAGLSSEAKITQHRLAELTLKTDRLLQKIN